MLKKQYIRGHRVSQNRIYYHINCIHCRYFKVLLCRDQYAFSVVSIDNHTLYRDLYSPFSSSRHLSNSCFLGISFSAIWITHTCKRSHNVSFHCSAHRNYVMATFQDRMIVSFALGIIYRGIWDEGDLLKQSL